MDRDEELREAIRRAMERITQKVRRSRTTSEVKQSIEETRAAEEKEARTRRAKFATYCALTCLGGSERKECPCKSPGDCHMREEPGFKRARSEAIARMKRFAVRSMPALFKEESDG